MLESFTPYDHTFCIIHKDLFDKETLLANPKTIRTPLENRIAQLSQSLTQLKKRLATLQTSLLAIKDQLNGISKAEPKAHARPDQIKLITKNL